MPAEKEAAHEIPYSSWAACRRRMAARQLKLWNKEPKLTWMVLAKQLVSRVIIFFDGEKE